MDLQAIRNIPIESAAHRLGLTIQKHKALCPFHDDRHPSLTFYARTNTYHCFVCEAHGSVIDLAMKVLHKPFFEACQWLADEHNILPSEARPAPPKFKPIPRPDVEWLSYLVKHPQLNEAARHFLFTERRFSPAVVRWLGISSISQATPCWRYGRPYFDAPSLLIPYRDIHGHLLSVQSRYLGTSRDIPRFRFPRGSRCGIYNLPILTRLRPGEDLWITEGVTDCIAMLSSGRKAIAIPSATLLTRDDKKTLQAYATTQSTPLRLHMYPDADIPGERLYLELVRLAGELGASIQRHSLPPGIKDFGELWAQRNRNP